MTRNLIESTTLTAWRAIAPSNTRLEIACENGIDGVVRLDFALPDGPSFVVARRGVLLTIPEQYSFHLDIRGHAPRLTLEFKLVDESGLNVWRYRKPDFECTDEWQTLVIADHEIEFAWGPRQTDRPSRIAAVEIALVADAHVNGAYWLRNLILRDDTYRATPRVSASSALPGHAPDNVLARDATAWRSATGGAQFIAIDFEVPRAFSVVEIAWVEELRPRSFVVQGLVGTAWRAVYAVHDRPGLCSYCYVPETTARCLRIDLTCATDEQRVGIRHIVVKPPAFARTIDRFFEAIAGESRRGFYPKYLSGKQSYWTAAGTPNPIERVLINEDGMVEVGDGTFSIEPFVHSIAGLTTWADVTTEQRLVDASLPLPSVTWRAAEFALTTAVCVTRDEYANELVTIRYELENLAPHTRALRLFAAIRPFQVTPSWQRFERYGGVAPIKTLAYDGATVIVNAERALTPLTAPTAFGAMAFDQGALLDFLVNGAVPPQTQVYDAFASATGALRFDVDLAPGAKQTIALTVSRFPTPVTCASEDAWQVATQEWSTRLGACTIRLPPVATALAATIKTAAAQILISRQAPWLHPGPRRYARAYLRDGVIMGAALARLGEFAPLRDFLRAYAEFQAPDGGLPDCIDVHGAEHLPEFDAYGEFIFGVTEYIRLSGDRSVLDEFTAPVTRALAYLENLRAQRLGPQYTAPGQRLLYGLLPESMSHEGYMAHPVHAYWDDFWALRGMRDAADLATLGGDPAEAKRRTTLAEMFAHDLAASIEHCIDQHGIDTLPGAAELGDFDPSASALAFTIADAEPYLPAAAVSATFDRYLEGLRARAAGTIDWGNYSAYEIRIVNALVRLGRRADALELLAFLLADRRPLAWNQWPEQSWRDKEAPGFLGDLPHSWIGAEYILAALSFFAYERADDQSLVIAAGVAPTWLVDGFEIAVDGLVTHFGPVSYRLRQIAAGTLNLSLRGMLKVPPGGIVIQAPLPRALRAVEVNGCALNNFTAAACTVHEWPAEISLRC